MAEYCAFGDIISERIQAESLLDAQLTCPWASHIVDVAEGPFKVVHKLNGVMSNFELLTIEAAHAYVKSFDTKLGYAYVVGTTIRTENAPFYAVY